MRAALYDVLSRDDGRYEDLVARATEVGDAELAEFFERLVRGDGELAREAERLLAGRLAE